MLSLTSTVKIILNCYGYNSLLLNLYSSRQPGYSTDMSQTTYARLSLPMTPRLAVKQADPPRWRVALAFTAVYLIWGSTYLAIRFAMPGLPPFLMSGVRHFTAGLVLSAIARMRGAPLRPGRSGLRPPSLEACCCWAATGAWYGPRAAFRWDWLP